jgi:light-regulated signal transduction histidine kinase (bacteriophytochrome)
MLRTGQIQGAEQARALEVIERNANAQVQLVDDLLDVSRVITGKMRLDVRAVDLPAVVATALDTVRPAADAKGLRLQSVLDPRAGPITGDPDRLQQVVWNLLSNAVKFTPKGGRVQVHLQRVNSHVEIVASASRSRVARPLSWRGWHRLAARRRACGLRSRAHGRRVQPRAAVRAPPGPGTRGVVRRMRSAVRRVR